MDPIVAPDAIASHVHSITGASGISYGATYEDLRNSKCTTCQVTQDHSAYWVPQLYYQHQNGTFESVDLVTGITVYYLPRGPAGPAGKVLAIPNGLRMLAGDPYRRSFNDSNIGDRAIGYSCLGGNGYNRELSTITNCPNGLRQEIFFPNCWDGVNLDSADHQSHMAYSGDDGNGACPASHPVKLVSLFYEAMWGIDYWKDSWWNGTTSPFVFAMGDPTGYGSHGDFMSGWDEDFLQTAVDTCTNNSGLIQDCPIFDIDYDSAGSCKWEGTLMTDEDVFGTHGGLEALPGCNPVYWGPDEAPLHPASCPVSATPNAPVIAAVSLASSSASSSAATSAATSSAAISSTSSAIPGSSTTSPTRSVSSSSSISGVVATSSSASARSTSSFATMSSTGSERSVAGYSIAAEETSLSTSISGSTSASRFATRSRSPYYGNSTVTESSSPTALAIGDQLLAAAQPTARPGVATTSAMDSEILTPVIVSHTAVPDASTPVAALAAAAVPTNIQGAAASAVETPVSLTTVSDTTSPTTADSATGKAEANAVPDSQSDAFNPTLQAVITSTLAVPMPANTAVDGNVVYVTETDIEYITVTTTMLESASPYVQLYVIPKSVALSYVAQQAVATPASAEPSTSTRTLVTTQAPVAVAMASMKAPDALPSMGVYYNMSLLITNSTANFTTNSTASFNASQSVVVDGST